MSARSLAVEYSDILIGLSVSQATVMSKRREGMNSTKKTARVAGLLYLLTSIPGAFCIIYVPSHFIVFGDVAPTASKILASEFVFRLGIVSELASFTGFIFVV